MTNGGVDAVVAEVERGGEIVKEGLAEVEAGGRRTFCL